MKTVYLAGPITDRSYLEANDWRNDVACRLADCDIRGISPLRCEPMIGTTYQMNSVDPKFGSAKAIANKNFFDISMTDMTLCYMPKQLAFSKGTCVELAWAFALRKPTILVCDEPEWVKHPCIQACSGWVLETLDEAVDLIVGILGDYPKGAGR